ncbi:hypothetical protein HAQ01_01750 [Acidithiobacillus thiooxidans]|jgi:hypothetical protein|uniref:hypothetical protein n=1 Tax=Acidithiobacillus thiooxidans TaxID=930 RepID=UPI0002625322|nr:hypothetical protein [Acidithiobacillus thiooxidans]MBU2792161.1 hypothetical protein [Acidithiobacillus thiooxidans]
MRFHVRIGIALNAQKYIFLGGIYNASPDALTDGAIIQCGLEPSAKIGSNILSGVLARLEGEVLGPHAQYREALWLEVETESGQNASRFGAEVVTFLQQTHQTDPDEALKRLRYRLASKYNVNNLLRTRDDRRIEEVFARIPSNLSWAF